MKTLAIRHIHRVDSDSRGTHAWLVRLQRHNRSTAKMFSDGVWGGKRKALAAARAWRDQQIQNHSQYEHQLWRRNRLRRNNRSGLVGVARYERKPTSAQPAGGAAFWLASWVDEHGASRKRKFSVTRWGERGAKRKAIEERDLQVRRAVASRVAMGR